MTITGRAADQATDVLGTRGCDVRAGGVIGVVLAVDAMAYGPSMTNINLPQTPS